MTRPDIALRITGALATLTLCAGFAAAAFEPDAPMLSQPIPAVLLPAGALFLGAYNVGAGVLRGLFRREVQLGSGLLGKSSIKGAGAVLVGLSRIVLGVFLVIVGVTFLR